MSGGFLYNYFRDYNPKTGRYIESDPIGLKGGSFSTYTYVNNKPTGKTDPTGLGPIAFGACSAANAGYQVYSFRQTMKELDSNSLQLLKDVLNRVNDEIDKCPMSNTKRRGELEAIRSNLLENLTKALQGPASSASMLGIGDIGSALIFEGACAALLVAPTP